MQVSLLLLCLLSIKLIELVAGPLCGNVIKLRPEHSEIISIRYYGGKAIYRVYNNGKAWYLRG